MSIGRRAIYSGLLKLRNQQGVLLYHPKTIGRYDDDDDGTDWRCEHICSLQGGMSAAGVNGSCR